MMYFLASTQVIIQKSNLFEDSEVAHLDLHVLAVVAEGVAIVAGQTAVGADQSVAQVGRSVGQQEGNDTKDLWR